MARIKRSTDDYFQRVFDVVRKIPAGRVTTYGAIASYLGGSARVTGWAMNASHLSDIPVPAHRVVNRNGVLTGKHHFESPELMEALLKAENIQIINDTVLNFEDLFWNPADEIR